MRLATVARPAPPRSPRPGDELAEPDRGAEVAADPILGHRPGDPGGGVAAGEAAADAADAEHGRCVLAVATGTADGIAEPPGGRHPEHLVDAAGGDGGRLGQP